MKKIIAVLLLVAMIIPVTSCGSGKNEPLQKEVERLEDNARKEADKKKAEEKAKAEAEKKAKEDAEKAAAKASAEEKAE
jgi:hypothetical protein